MGTRVGIPGRGSCTRVKALLPERLCVLCVPEPGRGAVASDLPHDSTALSTDPRGGPGCGGDSGPMPGPALGRPASSPGRSHRAGPACPREAGLGTLWPPYPRRSLLAPPPSLHSPRSPQRRSRSSPGRGTIPTPPPRPAGPAPDFRWRHFRRGERLRRAGVRGGSQTNSARGSSGVRRWLRWTGGGGAGFLTCSPRPVETVGGRRPGGEERRPRGPTWEAELRVWPMPGFPPFESLLWFTHVGEGGNPLSSCWYSGEVEGVLDFG